MPCVLRLLIFVCSEEDIVISEVFAVARPTEHLPKDGKQRQLLYHSSSPENYLGILSR